MNDNLRFFTWNRLADWERGEAFNLSMTRQGVTIRQAPQYTAFQTAILPDVLGRTPVTDMAAGPHGQLYVLDRQGALWLFDPDNRTAEPLFAPEHGLFGGEAMIAGSPRYIVVADPAGQAVMALSATNRQIVWTFRPAPEELFYPLALAADELDRVYVLLPSLLEHDPDGQLIVPVGAAVEAIRLLPSGRRDDTFHALLGEVAEAQEAESLRADWFAAVDGERLYTLDARSREVTVFKGTERHSSFSLPQAEPEPAGLTVDGRGTLYIGGRGTPQRHIVDARFIHVYASDGSLLHTLHSYQGNAHRLLAHPNGHLYVLDRSTGRCTGLRSEMHSQTEVTSEDYTGVYYCELCDSGMPGTLWHKMVLDADIPAETQLRIYYIATEKPDTTDAWIRRDQMGEMAWSGPVRNPKDALFHLATGRYLRIKIELVGNERRTPVLRSFRVFFPRQTLLGYLPEVYQEDEISSDFLERFLALFDTFFSDMETAIDGLAKYADAEAVNGEFLQWLGNWVGITERQNWTDDQLRRFIRQSPSLYRRRGTRAGLESVLGIFLEERPFIIEPFELRPMLEHADFEPIARELYGNDPYSFSIVFQPGSVKSEEQQQAVRRLVADHKPAYTQARLIFLEPRMYLDLHTYLGVNSRLDRPEELKLDRQSAVPHRMELTQEGNERRLDQYTRLEMNSELD